MSEPIKVGDLVQVVKPLYCCGNDSGLGCTFQVEYVSLYELGRCVFCLRSDQPGPMASRADGSICQISRLKRIPPLSELEGQRTEETTRDGLTITLGDSGGTERSRYLQHFKVKS